MEAGGIWWGVPSGSTSIAFVMCWMTVLPAGGLAVLRATLGMRGGGMLSGSMGWLGKIQRVYSAPGSLGVLLALIQSMALNTMRGCGPLRSTQRRPREGQKRKTQ